MALTGRAGLGFIIAEPGRAGILMYPNGPGRAEICRAGLAIFGPYRALIQTPVKYGTIGQIERRDWFGVGRSRPPS